jgi:hypothetical protein
MRLNIRRWIYIATASFGIAGGIYFLDQHLEYVKMHTIPPGLRAFDVNAAVPTCGRWKDTMPKSRDPAAYKLYIEARKLWRSKIEWQLTRQESLRILHDVQSASDQGDWGARALMAYFFRSGLGPLDSNHVLDPDGDKSVAIVRTAVAAGQAWGYYDLGVAYEHGYGGAWQDEQIAWAYYLRAAEMGSPEAQMTLAGAYLKAKRLDAQEAMRMCAYRQGHGAAAYDLGVVAELRKNFQMAIEYYQTGAKFGSEMSAFSVGKFFDIDDWSRRDKIERDALKQLDIVPDPERERRYTLISQALDLNPDLRLTRLDQILPLPPAELPAWRGIQEAIEPEVDGPPSY